MIMEDLTSAKIIGKHSIDYYACLSRAAYIKNEAKIESFMRQKGFNIELLSSQEVCKWKIILCKNKDSGEYVVAGRGTSNLPNWVSNVDAHTTKLFEGDIKKGIEETIAIWEEHFGKVIRTGHSGAVRYLCSPAKPGIYFNGDGGIVDDDNINLRTSKDLVTKLPWNKGKSHTIGHGKHSQEDVVAAVTNFTIEKHNANIFEEIPGYLKWGQANSEDATQMAKELKQKLSNIDKETTCKIAECLAEETAKIIIRYFKKSEKGSASSCETLIQEFETHRDLLGLRDLSINHFKDCAAQHIKYALLHYCPQQNSPILNVHEMEKAIREHVKSINYLEENYQKFNHNKESISSHHGKLQAIEGEVLRKYRKATNRSKQIRHYMSRGNLLLKIISKYAPLPHSVGDAITIASNKIGNHTSVLKATENNLSRLSDARKCLQEASYRNDSQILHVNKQLEQLYGYTQDIPRLFDPIQRQQILESEKVHYQRQLQVLEQHKEEIQKESDQLQKNYTGTIEHQSRSHCQKGKKGRKRNLECETVKVEIKSELIALDIEKQNMEDQIAQYRHQLKSIQKTIDEEKSVERLTRHNWNALKLNRKKNSKEIQFLQDTFSTCIEMSSSQTYHQFGPAQQTIAAFQNIAEQIQGSSFASKVPFAAATCAGHGAEIAKQVKIMHDSWENFKKFKECDQFQKLKAEKGEILATVELVEAGAFLTTAVIPGLQVIAASLAIYKSGKYLYDAANEEGQENPFQSLANFILRGLDGVVEEQNGQLKILESKLSHQIAHESKQNRDKLKRILDLVQQSKGYFNDVSEEIRDEIKSQGLQQEKKFDEQKIVLFKDKIESKRRKISRSSPKYKDLQSNLNDICDPDLNGWHAGETFLNIPIESIISTPNYYTGLLANKIGKECPSLYLYNAAVAPLIDSADKLNLNLWNKEKRQKLLDSCKEAKKLGLNLMDLFKDINPFIEKALNANKSLKDSIPKNRLHALGQQNNIRLEKLIRKEGLLFDFKSQIEKKFVGQQKFSLSDYSYRTQAWKIDKKASHSPHSLDLELNLTHFMIHSAIARTYPSFFFASKCRLPSIKGESIFHLQSKEYIKPFIAEVQSLGEKKISQLPAKLNLNLTSNLLVVDEKISFYINVFFHVPDQEKLCKIYSSNFIHYDRFKNAVQWNQGYAFHNIYSFSEESHQKMKKFVSINYIFEYNDPQRYFVEADPDSLFQVEDCQKIPPPTLDPAVSNIYNSNFQNCLNNYKEYLSSRLVNSACEEVNLFTKKFRSNTDDCILPSMKNNLIPLVFPKKFLDHWISFLRLENDSLMAMEEGFFLPFYDLISPSLPGDPYQLAIEFCYYEMNRTNPKKYGKVVAAEFDEKTIDSFKKIKTTKTGESEVEKVPNINEFLFQAMYTDLLGSGLPDKLSYRLSNGQYVAAHETPFIGLYHFLEEQPEQMMMFDSRQYDEHIFNGLVRFLESGDAAETDNFAKLAIFECGKDYQQVAEIIRDVRLNPYKNKHKEFAEYEESYYLLQAAAQLTSEEDKGLLTLAIENYLGLEKPNKQKLPKSSGNVSDVEALTKMIAESPNRLLGRLQTQMKSLDSLMDRISETLEVPEQLSWIC